MPKLSGMITPAVLGSLWRSFWKGEWARGGASASLAATDCALSPSRPQGCDLRCRHLPVPAGEVQDCVPGWAGPSRGGEGADVKAVTSCMRVCVLVHPPCPPNTPRRSPLLAAWFVPQESASPPAAQPLATPPAHCTVPPCTAPPAEAPCLSKSELSLPQLCGRTRGGQDLLCAPGEEATSLLLLARALPCPAPVPTSP